MNKGFSLVELIVTIAVGAVLLTVAVPNFTTLTQNNRLSTAANQVVAHLSFARSEAVKRSVSVSMCKSTDQATCDNSADWDDGWIVFVDRNGNRSADVGEEVIRSHQGLSRNTLRGDINLANSACFSSRGFAGGCAGDLRICDDRNDTNNARTITIDATGRVSTTTTAISCP